MDNLLVCCNARSSCCSAITLDTLDTFRICWPYFSRTKGTGMNRL